jgi:hypothetical protein
MAHLHSLANSHHLTHEIIAHISQRLRAPLQLLLQTCERHLPGSHFLLEPNARLSLLFQPLRQHLRSLTRPTQLGKQLVPQLATLELHATELPCCRLEHMLSALSTLRRATSSTHCCTCARHQRRKKRFVLGFVARQQIQS